MASIDKFNDHCWNDVVPEADMKLYMSRLRYRVEMPKDVVLANFRGAAELAQGDTVAHVHGTPPLKIGQGEGGLPVAAERGSQN